MTLNDTRSWYTGYGAGGKWETITSCDPQFRHDLEIYLATHNSHYKSLQVGFALLCMNPARTMIEGDCHADCAGSTQSMRRYASKVDGWSMVSLMGTLNHHPCIHVWKLELHEMMSGYLLVEVNVLPSGWNIWQRHE